jgi:hypothetical protein
LHVLLICIAVSAKSPGFDHQPLQVYLGTFGCLNFCFFVFSEFIPFGPG